MGEFKDSPRKIVVRRNWCKPLLEFIYEKLSCKLIYLGLPGPQALDLMEWIDYIDQVVAFQCRDYPNPSSVRQPRDQVVELEHRLTDLERKGRLSTFSLYDGFIEEVVLKGRDTNGDSFGQDDVVTIYNLDFCNGITVPLEIADDQGNVKQFYKSDAIRRLLEIQRDISSQARVKKFVMFLTVYAGFWHEEARNFVSNAESQALTDYFSRIDSLTGHVKRVRLLKAYVFDTVKGYFCNYDFTPEFLPVINYRGVGRKWLSLFTIIGAENREVSAAPCFQDTRDFLRQKLLTVQNDSIAVHEEAGCEESNCENDSVSAFKASQCYARLWNDRGS